MFRLVRASRALERTHQKSKTLNCISRTRELIKKIFKIHWNVLHSRCVAARDIHDNYFAAQLDSTWQVHLRNARWFFLLQEIVEMQTYLQNAAHHHIAAVTHVAVAAIPNEIKRIGFCTQRSLEIYRKHRNEHAPHRTWWVLSLWLWFCLVASFNPVSLSSFSGLFHIFDAFFFALPFAGTFDVFVGISHIETHESGVWSADDWQRCKINALTKVHLVSWKCEIEVLWCRRPVGRGGYRVCDAQKWPCTAKRLS